MSWSPSKYSALLLHFLGAVVLLASDQLPMMNRWLVVWSDRMMGVSMCAWCSCGVVLLRCQW